MIAAGVVRGDDRDVGELPRDPPHQRAFAAVAIAAAAEDADDAPVGELARGPEGSLEGVRLVGIVDEHGEGLTFVDGLEGDRNAAT